MKISFKRLTTLALCVVACMSVSAKATISGGVLTINGSNDVQFNNLNELGGGQVTKIKLVGDFRNGWTGYWVQNGPAQEKMSITEIDMSEADMSGDNNVWSFCNFAGLKKVVWPKEGKITNIPSFAFKQSGLEEIRIPGYIKFIRSQAIDEESNAKTLKKVFFDKLEGNDANVRMHIERQAFSNTYGLTDVFILTEGVITAENNAFAHYRTFGHADVNRFYAILHYPKSKIELYVNMNHVLTEQIICNDKLFQEWLIEHFDEEAVKKYHNGFYEFLNSGPIDVKPEPVGTSNLYTFSATESYIVPAGVKAYVVNSISTDPNNNKVLHLSLKSVNVIPAYTGVIIYGGTNAFDQNGKPYIQLIAAPYVGEPFTRESNIKNYLSGTADMNGQIKYIMPTQKYPGSDIVYYNYWMGYYSQTESGKIYKKNHGNYGNGIGRAGNDWASFFRIIKEGGEAPLGKAYLSLSSNEFPFAAAGGAIVIDADDQLDPSNMEFYRREYKDQNMNLMSEDEMKAAKLWYLSDGTKIEWAKDWGIVNINFNEIIASPSVVNAKKATGVEEDGIAGSIVEKNKGDNNIYTLTGVKVDNPTKGGVYIKNGKKFIVK